MKDSEDKDFQEYLNGRDKVSATYQSLQDEKPSAALDESILQLARESVADKVAKQPRIPRQAYSIAASISVAVLVVSLFVNNEAEFTSVEIESFSIPVSDMPAVEMLSADDALGDIQSNANADTVEVNANRIALPAPQIEADSLEAAGATVLSSAVEEAVQEVEAFEARVMEAEIATVQRQEAQEQNNVYRQNIDSWLLEILRLSETDNETELAEERGLFTQAYPDIDIDSALANLRQ